MIGIRSSRKWRNDAVTNISQQSKRSSRENGTAYVADRIRANAYRQNNFDLKGLPHRNQVVDFKRCGFLASNERLGQCFSNALTNFLVYQQ